MTTAAGTTLSVLNKEWHERRWKLAFGCVILMGFTAIGLQTRLVEDRVILAAAVALGAFILPLFIGMGVVATDRAEGSLATLLALPVRPSLVMLVKLAVGLAGCIAPLVGVGLVAGQREIAGGETFRLLALGCAAAAMVLLWTVTLGVRQRTEARAALIGMTFLVLGFAGLVFASIVPYEWLQWACLIHPAALIWLPSQSDQDTGTLVRTGLALQPVLAVFLCLVAIHRLNPAAGGRR